MSSILLFFTLTQLHAHEVRPAVADVTVDAAQIQIDVTLTLEAILSGIDLQGVEDTNDSPLSGYYDQLREMDSADIRALFDSQWPVLKDQFYVRSEGAPIEVQVVDLRIPPVGDVELPRDSVLSLRADLPAGESPVQVGWSGAYGPLIVRQTGEGDALYTGYLTTGALSDPLPRLGVAEVGGIAHFARYVALGFEHILPKGLDHILFVLGLFFFSLKMRPLLVQVTAFTAAHTVTLALAILGIVSVPAEIVEPLIALSIVYVAIENVFRPRLGWWRTVVVFAFGLLHGLGFASVLGEIGLAPARLVSGLIGFNIGVELGQLTVIAAAYLVVGYWFGAKAWYRSRIAIPASLIIATVGAWWVIERTLLVA